MTDLDPKARRRLPSARVAATVGLLGLAGGMFATAAIADRGPEGHGPRGHMEFLDFDKIDANADGKITQDEIAAFRKARVDAADADKDGFLSAEELAAMHLAAMTERANGMAAKMIERHDADGDGKLTAAEMAAPPMPERMFDRLDTDKDGAISKDEAEAAKARFAERMDGHGKHKRHMGSPQD